MSPNDQRYKDAFVHKMDPKFRVSIPVGWRPAPNEILHLQKSDAYDMPVIKVLNNDAYYHRVKLINESNYTPAKKTQKLGKLAMNCREVTLNDQGKLLIPKELSERVGLQADAEVVLAGRGLHFEIWNKDNYKRFVELEEAEDEDDDLGVN